MWSEGGWGVILDTMRSLVDWVCTAVPTRQRTNPQLRGNKSLNHKTAKSPRPATQTLSQHLFSQVVIVMVNHLWRIWLCRFVEGFNLTWSEGALTSYTGTEIIWLFVDGCHKDVNFLVGGCRWACVGKTCEDSGHHWLRLGSSATLWPTRQTASS